MADGIYAWSMSGNADEIQRIYAMADANGKGRTTAPRKVAGSGTGSTDNPDYALKAYIKEYVKGSAGEQIAGLVAENALMSTDKAIAQGILT